MLLQRFCPSLVNTAMPGSGPLPFFLRSGGISNAVCIHCEFQLFFVWIIGIQRTRRERRMCRVESTCTGLLKYSSHSPGNCPRLHFSASLLFLCPLITVAQFNGRNLLSCSSSTFFRVVARPSKPFSTFVFIHFVSVTLIFLLPVSTLIFISIFLTPTSDLLFTCDTLWEDKWDSIMDSWIGYADVTDTPASHKYTSYYLPLCSRSARPRIHLA